MQRSVTKGTLYTVPFNMKIDTVQVVIKTLYTKLYIVPSAMLFMSPFLYKMYTKGDDIQISINYLNFTLLNDYIMIIIKALHTSLTHYLEYG